MRKLVLFFELFYYIFFSTKNYSSENKDNFDLDIIGYKEFICLDIKTIKKLKNCFPNIITIKDIQGLKEKLIGKRHSENPSTTIVIIKVTNKNEVEEFKNNFMNFFDDFIKKNEALEEDVNTEVNNPLSIRKFYFVFIDKDDINYNKTQKGMNNEIIPICIENRYCGDGSSYTLNFYDPIGIADLGNAIYSIHKSICPEKYVSKNCCCDCCDICNIM